MSTAKRKYQCKETIIGAVISTAISIIFVCLIFEQAQDISVFGEMGIIVDAIPQSLGIAFMATLVPTLMTRKRIADSQINAIEGSLAFLPKNLFTRSLSMAILFTILGIALHFAIFSLWNVDSMSFNNVLIFKAAYGALLGALVAFTALSHLRWGDEPQPKAEG